jgi:hypothetical protein
MVSVNRAWTRDTNQVVQLHGRNALVDTRDDLLGDGNGIDMIWVEAIAQAGNASGDLVELDALPAAIYRCLARRTVQLLERRTAFVHEHVGSWLSSCRSRSGWEGWQDGKLLRSGLPQRGMCSGS